MEDIWGSDERVLHADALLECGHQPFGVGEEFRILWNPQLQRIPLRAEPQEPESSEEDKGETEADGCPGIGGHLLS